MCGVCEYSPYDHEEFMRLLSEAIGRGVAAIEQRWPEPELIPPAFRRKA